MGALFGRTEYEDPGVDYESNSDLRFPCDPAYIRQFARAGVLGKGTYGKVYRYDAAGKNSLAIKFIDDKLEWAQECLVGMEIKTLQDIDGKPGRHLVHFLCQEQLSATRFIIAMPLFRGTLQRALAYQGYDRVDAARALIGLAQGLRALHELDFMHRDVKPNNIFLRSRTDLVLGDFGLAVVRGYSEYSSEVGAAYYQAPELVDGRQKTYDVEVDWWSFGIVVVDVTHGIALLQNLRGRGTSKELIHAHICRPQGQPQPSHDFFVAGPEFKTLFEHLCVYPIRPDFARPGYRLVDSLLGKIVS